MRGPIKLCGFTVPEEAAAAAALGASHVGVVWWARSTRGLTDAGRVRAIGAAARGGGAALVGVIVRERGAELIRAARELDVDLLQLHGAHDLDDARRLREAGVPFWRALRVGAPGVGPESAARWVHAGAAAILLDPYRAGVPGGTGARLDPAAALTFSRRGPVVLAGGLTPENVGAAIFATGAWGVDVASGIERSPGLKDRAAMAAFVTAARSALAPSPPHPQETP